MGLMIAGAVVATALVLVLLSGLRVVREYQRLVIFRLGRYVGERGPGLVLVIPGLERAELADLRERFISVPRQTCITKDNAPIEIDFLIYSKVVHPGLSVVNVENYAQAAEGLATTTLRAVIGDILLDDVLAKREEINDVLRAKLDEATERWGVKVTTVEIREILPPVDIQAAMNRQMSAERERRAAVTEAEGRRQATITVAEGEKQAAILQAEGQKQADILAAEGERQSAILRAEGFAEALQRTFLVAQAVDPNTMTLQKLEALKSLGASPSTKFVFPMEFTTLLGSIIGDRGAATPNGSTQFSPASPTPFQP